MSDLLILLLLEILSGLFAVVYIICSFYSLPKYRLSVENIQNYIDNWNSGPIVDIKIDQNRVGDTCSDIGYQPFIFNKYPGLHEGCNCLYSTSISYKGKVFDDICNDDQINKGCSPVPEVQDKLLKWKNTNICVKRNNNINYINMVSNTLSNSGDYLLRHKKCLLNEVSCGKVDTMNNLLCVKNENLCPLNFIAFGKNNGPDKTSPVYFGTAINSKDKTINRSYKILNQFIVNNHEMCVTPNEGLLGQNNFYLNYLLGQSECYEDYALEMNFDYRYETVDLDNGNKFYDNNNLTGILSSIKGYYYNNETNMNLFSINYFGISTKFIRKLRNEGYNDFNISGLIEPNFKNNSKLVYCLSLCSFLYIFFFLAQVVFVFYAKDFILKLELAKITAVIIIFLIACDCLVFYVKNTWMYNLIMSSYIRSFDDITLNSFSLAYKSVNESFTYLLAMTIVCLIDVSLRIYLNYFMRQKRKEEENNKKLY